MRLTDVLYRHNILRAFNNIWRRRAKFIHPPAQIPPELQELGVKIYDILDVVKDKTITVDTNAIATKYKSPAKKYYLYDKDVKVEEDESHVLVLTKTLLYKQLPKIIRSLIGVEQFPDQDKMVKDSILAACVLDSHQDSFKRIRDPENPRILLSREYGILNANKAFNLAKNLSNLADMMSGKFPLVLDRTRTQDAVSEIVLNRRGDNIVFHNFSDVLLTSKKPLKPFSLDEEVQRTKTIELPSIYPVKPTVDLWHHDTNPSKFAGLEDIFSANIQSFNYVHTLHITNPAQEVWLPMQEMCRALVTSFTFAAEEAHRLYGNEVKELPRPVCVQCTYFNAQSMGVLAYQLNTLDFENDDGIKNQAWVQDPKDFYSKATELHGIEDFNSDVFPDLLALYLNGVHPLSL